MTKSVEFIKRTEKEVMLVDIAGKTIFSVIAIAVIFKGLTAFLSLIGLKGIGIIVAIISIISGIYAGYYAGNIVTRKFINTRWIITDEMIRVIKSNGEYYDYEYANLIPKKYKDKLKEMTKKNSHKETLETMEPEVAFKNVD